MDKAGHQSEGLASGCLCWTETPERIYSLELGSCGRLKWDSKSRRERSLEFGYSDPLFYGFQRGSRGDFDGINVCELRLLHVALVSTWVPFLDYDVSLMEGHALRSKRA